MLMPKNFELVGLKDMHTMQVDALINFIGLAIRMASKSKCDHLVAQVAEDAHELVRLFGGGGVEFHGIIDEHLSTFEE